MDASSTTAVRQAPAPIPFPNVDRLEKERRVRLAEETRQFERHARDIAEAFDAGRLQTSMENWVAGAKVGVFCGVLLGGCGAAALVSIFLPMGLFS